jgi:hypothetical protein
MRPGATGRWLRAVSSKFGPLRADRRLGRDRCPGNGKYRRAFCSPDLGSDADAQGREGQLARGFQALCTNSRRLPSKSATLAA